MSKMNRRSFLRGAATAAAVVAVPIAAVGQQERFLVKNLGVPKSAEAYDVVAGAQGYAYGTEYNWAHRMQDVQQSIMLVAGYYAGAKGLLNG